VLGSQQGNTALGMLGAAGGTAAGGLTLMELLKRNKEK
jgi:hypothetical protein